MEQGFKLRLAGAAVFGAGLLVVGSICNRDAIGCGIVIGFSFSAVGGSLLIGGSIYEMVTAPRAARRYNDSAAKRQLAIVPIAVGPTLGLTVAGAF